MPKLLLTRCQVSAGLASRVGTNVSSSRNTPHHQHPYSRLCMRRSVAQQLPRKRTPATTTGSPTTQRQPRVLCSSGKGYSSARKEEIGRKADQIVEALKDNGVKCVAFDMDQTVVSRHSRGNLRRKKYDWFKGHVTEAFVELVPRLSAAGMYVYLSPMQLTPRPPGPALQLLMLISLRFSRKGKACQKSTMAAFGFAGIKLAIATASDREEYRLKGTNSTTHMLGEDLVLPLLKVQYCSLMPCLREGCLPAACCLLVVQLSLSVPCVS